MTRHEIEDFLHEGALLKTPAGELYLWRGSFSPLSAGKSKDFSIAYRDFFETKTDFLKHSQGPIKGDITLLREDLRIYFADSKPSLGRQDFVPPLRENFEKSFQVIQGKIQREEIEKAVPVTTARASKTVLKKDLAIRLYHALEAPSPLYVYGFWKNSEGVLGATPEILFSKQGSLIQTMALAGTCPKSELSHRTPLLKDEKEMHEHRVVLTDICQRLDRLGFVRKGETEVIELPHMFHLRTLIEVETQGSAEGIEELLIKNLHPTPALGVSPRNYGLNWMRELPDQADRRWFGAPIVFKISPQQSLAVVAIRNLQWNKDQSWISSGCGLVKASQMNQEWQELEAKRESVFKTLGF